MKYVLTLFLINSIILTSLAQELITESRSTLERPTELAATHIAKIEIQDLNNGSATVKVWISSTEVSSLDYVKLQFSGQRIPRGTVLSTLKGESTISSLDGSTMIIMQTNIVISDVTGEGADSVDYVYKKSGPVNFRNIKAGQVLIFPPIKK